MLVDLREPIHTVLTKIPIEEDLAKPNKRRFFIIIFVSHFLVSH